MSSFMFVITRFGYQHICLHIILHIVRMHILHIDWHTYTHSLALARSLARSRTHTPTHTQCRETEYRVWVEAVAAFYPVQAYLHQIIVASSTICSFCLMGVHKLLFILPVSAPSSTMLAQLNTIRFTLKSRLS